MRVRTAGLLAAVSALVGVLATVVVVYVLTVGDTWARDRVGLPAEFVGYRVSGEGTGDAAMGARLLDELDELGSVPAAVVASSVADTGPAAVGVLDTSGALRMLTGAARELVGPTASGGPRVVVVKASYTADQLARSGEATFLPADARVVGTTSYPWLPRDTQYLYDLASGPLPAGDYHVRGSAGVQDAVVALLVDAGHRVEPLVRPTLREEILQAPFTTVFAALLLGATGCFALLVVNQLTFHRARVEVHRLHGAHTSALLRRVLPLGVLVAGAAAALGSMAVLLLARGRLDMLGAAVGWLAAWGLVVAVGCLAFALGARVQVRRERTR